MAVPNEKEAYEFVMGFISNSDSYKQQFIGRWQEVLSNFIVEPTTEDLYDHTSPYRRGAIYSSRKNRITLKDPETHKAIMTYASKLVKALFSERDRAYIKAKPRGWEDAPQKAPTVSRLLRYGFSLPGTFRTFVESTIDMLLFGTSVVEVNWHYEEREMPVRTVTRELGIETDEFQRLRIPTYDDVRLTPVDITDFYPDPSRYRIQDMAGAAKRFKMNAIQAFAKAESGLYDKSAVRMAVNNIGRQSSVDLPESFRQGLDQPSLKISQSDFRDMIGFEYWGDVPWEDDQKSSRRVITVLNNVVVRNDPWPLADPALPWHTMVINPVQGRFYGVSPAEVIRFDQDFTDALKILLAEAVIRQVHPPIAFDPDSDIDVGALKAWKADALIASRGGPGSVGVLRYDANVQSGFGMMNGLKLGMQEASGALGGIQGEPGPDREAATVGAARLQFAMDRPELAAMVIENDCLPGIGEGILRRYQQFLDTEGLIQRVGEQPEPVWIGDIMGDFDIEFVGSRLGMSKQEKLQSFDRLAALASAVPPLQAMIPWQEIARELVGDLLELPEIAGRMQDPRTMMLNMLLMQQLGPGGPAQNGVPQQAEPAGMLPAQSGGSSEVA